jgi:hypothetical protein
MNIMLDGKRFYADLQFERTAHEFHSSIKDNTSDPGATGHNRPERMHQEDHDNAISGLLGAGSQIHRGNPFRNSTNLRHIGMGVTSDLATKLSANGSCKVYDRTLLKAYLNEHDLQMAFSSDEQVAASAMVKIGKVNAILTGAVTTCNWSPTRTQVKVVSQRFYNPNGTSYTRPIRHFTYTNEAEITANASLLHITPNGPVVIHSPPLRGYMKSTGPKPKYSREACLAMARALIVRELVEQFAVVRKIIKIKPSESFFTATDQPYAGKWPKSKNFSIQSGQKIILVMKLPVTCRKNRFTITVNRKDDRNELARFDLM